jgi:hypothetical protein
MTVRDHLEDLGEDESITLKWILKKLDGWNEFAWVKIGISSGLL